MKSSALTILRAVILSDPSWAHLGTCLPGCQKTVLQREWMGGATSPPDFNGRFKKVANLILRKEDEHKSKGNILYVFMVYMYSIYIQSFLQNVP